MTVDLRQGTATTPHGDETVISLEGVRGSPEDDVLLGTNGADSVSGDAGNDRIDGRGGDDMLFGDEDVDAVAGGPGEDVCGGERLMECEHIDSDP